MSNGQNVEHLIEEARKLPGEDCNRLITELLRERKRQESLLEFIQQLHPELNFPELLLAACFYAFLLRPNVADRRRITELRGLGKEVWQTEDAQDYVDAERESWNN